ncbi:MAG TPA: hypothetical protein VKJ65_12705 [Phycisphaerae bacterium]|nr:hypothetical protein [Phycisphaerae bacterium]
MMAPRKWVKVLSINMNCLKCVIGYRFDGLRRRTAPLIAVLLLALLGSASADTGTFRIAAYNVETYLDQPTASRHHAKSDAAKAKVRESIGDEARRPGPRRNGQHERLARTARVAEG